MAYTKPISDAQIKNLFGVTPEQFIEHYALPLEDGETGVSYTTKVGIYTFLSDYEYVLPKVRMAYTHYLNLAKDIEEKLNRESYSQYLKVMSARPFTYNGDTYIRTTKKAIVGTVDEQSGGIYIELSDTVARNMAHEMAKIEVESKMSVDISKITRHKEAFKQHLETITDVVKSMIAKLASLSNDHKVMSNSYSR